MIKEGGKTVKEARLGRARKRERGADVRGGGFARRLPRARHGFPTVRPPCSSKRSELTSLVSSYTETSRASRSRQVRKHIYVRLSRESPRAGGRRPRVFPRGPADSS